MVATSERQRAPPPRSRGAVDEVQLLRSTWRAPNGRLDGMERASVGAVPLRDARVPRVLCRTRRHRNGLRDSLRLPVRIWLIAQSPSMHRRAARRRVPPSELLRSYRAGEPMGEWPHLLAAAPGAPAPCL